MKKETPGQEPDGLKKKDCGKTLKGEHNIIYSLTAKTLIELNAI